MAAIICSYASTPPKDEQLKKQNEYDVAAYI